MTVSIACEECGKIYHIAKDRLSKLKGKTARIKCKDCGYLMTLRKPEAEPAEPESLQTEATSPAEVPDEQDEQTVVLAPPLAKEQEEQDRPKKVKKLKKPGLSIKGLSLRGNMTPTFFDSPNYLDGDFRSVPAKTIKFPVRNHHRRKHQNGHADG